MPIWLTRRHGDHFFAYADGCRIAAGALFQDTAFPRGGILSEIQHIARRVAGIPLAVGVAVAGVLAGVVAMWGYYGTAVFFEIVRAGWLACF